ncbi:hypothetical protein ZIOFF_058480 [Zingiber officinale]|uniref:Uncharacterized protein n=1 Tax=Zingiber officinale TaxID=94328 RepID=A0A8J5F3T8_ZINOF|nr:hypothetical protein ZIOFF_058480 [Zingiber officinale]
MENGFSSDEATGCYQFKDLFQHATGILASNSHKSSLKAQHCAFACFLQHDLAYPLPWEDLKATVVGGAVPTTVAAINSEPPRKEELFVWPWMVVLVNVDPSDAEGEANSLAAQFTDFHPTDTVFLHLEDEKGGRSTCTTVIIKFQPSWVGFENTMYFEKHFKRAGPLNLRFLPGKQFGVQSHLAPAPATVVDKFKSEVNDEEDA